MMVVGIRDFVPRPNITAVADRLCTSCGYFLPNTPSKNDSQRRLNCPLKWQVLGRWRAPFRRFFQASGSVTTLSFGFLSWTLNTDHLCSNFSRRPKFRGNTCERYGLKDQPKWAQTELMICSTPGYQMYSEWKEVWVDVHDYDFRN